jgi:hypothetical protein
MNLNGSLDDVVYMELCPLGVAVDKKIGYEFFWLKKEARTLCKHLTSRDILQPGGLKVNGNSDRFFGKIFR